MKCGESAERDRDSQTEVEDELQIATSEKGQVVGRRRVEEGKETPKARVLERNVKHDIEGKADNVQRTHGRPETEEEKIAMVGPTDAIVDPRTVVVHHQNARPADGTVVSSLRLAFAAFFALSVDIASDVFGICGV